jgi:uncharacterized protein
MLESTKLPNPIPAKAPRAFHLLAKPTGATCNLDCKYCFFLSKELLYPDSRFRMTDEVLEAYIRELLESHQESEVTIAWQGGEPTLMGLDFFKRSIELVRKYQKAGQTVMHNIQTNGIKVDEEFANFFKENHFLVGLSMDGPQEMHDTYRVNKGGQGTHKRVEKAWQILIDHGVDVNILCTVNAANADYPLEVYHYFRDELKAQYIQLIPIVERSTSEMLPLANEGWGERAGNRPLYIQAGDLVTERSVKAEQYGVFLSTIFDEWVRKDVGNVFVINFDASLANWLGHPSVCIFQKNCGQALAMEHNGDLYSCDHFVEPAYILGNILETHMLTLVGSDQQIKFGRDKYDTLPRYCRECEVLFTCYGECPRNRFIKTPDGEAGLNYLCSGYKEFFKHIDEPMKLMADLLQQGRYADEVMGILAENEKEKLKRRRKSRAS